MVTKLARNVLASLAALILLYYTSFFGSPFFHFLETLAVLIALSIHLSPPLPDKNMDIISAACINKRRFLPAGSTTHLVLTCYFDDCPEYRDVLEAARGYLEFDRFNAVPVESENAVESYWRKVEVKVEEHVVDVEVGDDQRMEEELNGLTSGELRPLEKGRPLWRLDILRNATGRSAVALVVDHAVGDGLGLLPVGLGGCLRLDGSPYIHEQFQARQKAPRKSPLALFRSFFLDLFEVLWVASGPFDSICNISKNSAKPALDFNETKRRIATVPDFELSDILEIKKKLGNDYTVNDILTALWSGTLRRYLIKTEDPLINSNQPILIRGQAPVSLPRAAKKGEVFCKMVFLVFKFAVGSPTIKERLAQARQEFENIKNSLKVPLMTGIGNLSLRLGLDDALINANRNQWHRTSFIFSNVMGPKEEIIMFGKKLVTFRPFYCNLIHQVIFFSYAGKVSLSMVLDIDNIKHPNVLAQCCLDELQDMKKEILN